MNITADTNVLVRIVMQDDVDQAAVAQALFLQANDHRGTRSSIL